jgi:hypothetical protein
MSTEKLKEKCVNYYKKLKKKSSKCRVKDLRKFAINIVARPVIISHAQRWNRYTIPHRCSARKTCIHCNMCNNARLETRKIGLHFCGTSPYTREPHQLLFTGAEPSGWFPITRVGPSQFGWLNFVDQMTLITKNSLDIYRLMNDLTAHLCASHSLFSCRVLQLLILRYNRDRPLGGAISPGRATEL